MDTRFIAVVQHIACGGIIAGIPADLAPYIPARCPFCGTDIAQLAAGVDVNAVVMDAERPGLRLLRVRT